MSKIAMRAKVTSIEQGQDSVVSATINTRVIGPSLDPFPKGHIIVYGKPDLANGRLAVKVGDTILSHGQVVIISLEVSD